MANAFAKKWQTSSNSNAFWQSLQSRFQKFGGYLSGMIVPVIGVIIAWGFLAMFFIPDAFNGATYVKEINILVGPIINYVVPILVGFMAGRQFYDLRGGVVGAFVTAGVVFGASWWVNSIATAPAPDIFGHYFQRVQVLNGVIQKDALGNTLYEVASAPNMLLGAMVAGSFSAIIFKRLEKLWLSRIPAGYEMLVNNYSIGFFGFVAILAAMFGITPVILYIMVALSIITNGIQSFNGLPLLSLIIEPAKPLFLNNAIGNGALVPVALNQTQQAGKSILFFAEANPGPGLGMLAAFVFFGSKRERSQASAALPVHFVGGIHEVYFPFVLANYLLVIPLILAGAAGLGIMQAFSAGLTQPMSPGSIISAYLSTSKTGLDYAGISVAIFGSAGISFVGSWLYLKLKKRRTSLDTGALRLTTLKGSASKYVQSIATRQQPVRLINVACDQGAGSSAAGASTIRAALRKANITNVKVINSSVKEINRDADVVVVLPGFRDLAQQFKGASATLFVVQNMIGQVNFEEVLDYVKVSQNSSIEANKQNQDPGALAPEFLATSAAKLELSFGQTQFNVSRGKNVNNAITLLGKTLLANGFIQRGYIAGMIKRNADVSVAIGNGLAIPHGQDQDRSLVVKTGLAITLYPEGIDWDEKKVYVAIALATKGQEHLSWIQVISTIFEDETFALRLAKTAHTAAEVNELIVAALKGIENGTNN